MRPILLQGHERPLTSIKYGADSDIFFSSAKDKHATVWYTATGERLGTYEGHNGSIWNLDVTPDTKHLLTASADNTCKIWDVMSGECLKTIEHECPRRNVSISTGGKMFSNAVYPHKGVPSHLKIYKLADDMHDQTEEVIQTIGNDKSGNYHTGNIVRSMWSATNQHVLTCSDDCTIRKWDVEYGKQVGIIDEDHNKPIQDIQFSADKTHFISSSIDSTAKVYDFHGMDSAPPGKMALKTLKTGANVNSAAIHPYLDHCLVAGGQDAASVTTTAGSAGKFEIRIFHKIYGEELGTVKGHFGPVNYVTYSPDGKSYVSGGEEGFVRVNTFDEEYFTLGIDEEDQDPRTKSAFN